MRGLVDGGPTRSGHRTPAFFVETGSIALDEAYARANSWVIQQLLDCGIHGIHQCHARDPKALDYVIGQIEYGAMVLECDEEAAIMGREHTKRKMPV